MLPAGFALLLSAVAFLQATAFRSDLADRVLESGRVVLAPEAIPVSREDPGLDGSLSNLEDGDPETAAVVAYPANHPEKTHFLIDLALTHWPGINGGPPRARVPVAIVVRNGLCTNCDRSRFEDYSRVRRAEFSILYRHANRIDEDYEIPPVREVWTRTITLPDSPDPFSIFPDLSPPPASNGWGDHMDYIILRIRVETVYPGNRFPGRLALAEVTWKDRALDPEEAPAHE
ncbi:MAG: hypothetical protein KDK35_17780 [Leptospiraceae bacterium]|nr:hypothetical protein [Leptospiraceae bacterium]MCP5483939.1 hypothetical protein [Spirochaetales bacterium]